LSNTTHDALVAANNIPLPERAMMPAAKPSQEKTAAHSRFSHHFMVHKTQQPDVMCLLDEPAERQGIDFNTWL
jgi:hypothetical protein